MSENLADVIEFYEPGSTVRIARFAEVANYLSQYQLWPVVERLLQQGAVEHGNRVEVDYRLANAVKLALLQHVGEAGEVARNQLVIDTIKCGGRSSGSGSRSGRGGGRG